LPWSTWAMIAMFLILSCMDKAPRLMFKIKRRALLPVEFV
jgi:hypothetical protein